MYSLLVFSVAVTENELTEIADEFEPENFESDDDGDEVNDEDDVIAIEKSADLFLFGRLRRRIRRGLRRIRRRIRRVCRAIRRFRRG